MLRTRGGWLVGLCGVLLCALGWYGVSGERYEARQLPYLASATIPGAALIVAGAVLVVGTRRGAGGADGSGAVDAELRSMVGQLYRLLVEPVPGDAAGAPAGPAADAPWVAVPGGARYHRRGCSLVQGKNGLFPVDATTALNKDLRPCRLCDPGRSAAASGAAAGSADPAEPTASAEPTEPRSDG
ncbi:hypothetical protein [Embleya sp. NBC_00896]|uniref:hypothetical protein n=1 Tax=Embleya sp. NBC_00896 TaxID=2975961 RepID=UPI00386A428C|nr:hypothetical protein OG928_25365 [Embleya sp. NBC_00896]